MSNSQPNSGADKLSADRLPIVSVVIPTYNEATRIHNCLNSLLAQETEETFEIIVVDSSTDATPEMIRSDYPEVKLIHRERQTFPAEARNIGIEKARGGIVAFIDADCVAASNWISAVAELRHRENPAVGGAVLLNRPATLAGTALFGIEFSEYGPGSPARDIRWQPSCNLAVKREALRKYGAFPTDMKASEDMLFTRRLIHRSGLPIHFNPQMRIQHSNRNTFVQLRGKLSTLGYWSGRSRATGLIPGGFLTRFPIAVPLLVPYRLINIMWRMLFRSQDTRLILMAILGWPIIAYALSGWAVAFYRGIRGTELSD